MWELHIKHYSNYLKLERSLSVNSVEAYVHDVALLHQFMAMKHSQVTAMKVTAKHLQEFLQYINELGMSAHSQARILSGIKGFYKYLLFEELVDKIQQQSLKVLNFAENFLTTLIKSKLKNFLKPLINLNQK